MSSAFPALFDSGTDPVLLMTGSKTWTFLGTVAVVLAMYTRHAFSLGKRLTVIHGDCKEGADALVANWITRHSRDGWPVDQIRYPADWSGPCQSGVCPPGHRKTRRNGAGYCPLAGILRNQVMIDTRPWWCEGLVRDNSPGSSHCVRAARAAGIPTERTNWQDRNRARDTLAGAR